VERFLENLDFHGLAAEQALQSRTRRSSSRTRLVRDLVGAFGCRLGSRD
jgi:hypothetical protein